VNGAGFGAWILDVWMVVVYRVGPPHAREDSNCIPGWETRDRLFRSLEVPENCPLPLLEQCKPLFASFIRFFPLCSRPSRYIERPRTSTSCKINQNQNETGSVKFEVELEVDVKAELKNKIKHKGEVEDWELGS
jgi:hypothetical protein